MLILHVQPWSLLVHVCRKHQFDDEEKNNSRYSEMQLPAIMPQGCDFVATISRDMKQCEWIYQQTG